MKTSFDLPEPLLRRAKATAAQQGRPLRELVVEAIAEKLESPGGQAPARRAEPTAREWQAYLGTLVQQPDGSYTNPNGVDYESFFEDLDNIRAERLAAQAQPFQPATSAAAAARSTPPSRAKPGPSQRGLHSAKRKA